MRPGSSCYQLSSACPACSYELCRSGHHAVARFPSLPLAISDPYVDTSVPPFPAAYAKRFEQVQRRGHRLSLPAPVASPQALSLAFPLAQEAGKQAHGHPLPHPACP
jgi:hypothetical protein